MPTGTFTVLRRVTDGACAACGARVTAILAQPSRLQLVVGATLRASRARVVLVPCGHSFAAPRGGLVH
jgi:hypothetical protein